MVKKIPKKYIKLSRKLRKDQTPWEAKLWQYLRNRRLSNLKFKRQVRLGNYIADFYCAERNLVIELDGGHHNEEITNNKDTEKQSYLENEGFSVLRFWNNDIDNNIEGVLERIRLAVKK